MRSSRIQKANPQDEIKIIPSHLMGEGEDEGDFKRLTSHDSLLTIHCIYRIDPHATSWHHVKMKILVVNLLGFAFYIFNL